MKLKLSYLAAIAAFSTVSLTLAAEPSFVGKWRFNPEKSKLDGLTYKIEDAGNGQVTFVFGERKETVGLDGKEHTTLFGNTWSITKAGENSWKWISKRDGKVYSDATWTAADGGQTSTYTQTETRPDGSTSKNETMMKRTGGSAAGGLIGTWEGSATKVGSPTMLEVAKSGDSYSMKDAVYQSATEFKLDGKDNTPKGPQVPEGMTVSAKESGANAIELTYKLKGKTTSTERWEMAADGKTLSQTETIPGETKKPVTVFDRE
jgi:hypothetical protein